MTINRAIGYRRKNTPSRTLNLSRSFTVFFHLVFCVICFGMMDAMGCRRDALSGSSGSSIFIMSFLRRVKLFCTSRYCFSSLSSCSTNEFFQWIKLLRLFAFVSNYQLVYVFCSLIHLVKNYSFASMKSDFGGV